MSFFEKIQTFIMLAAIGFGLTIGHLFALAQKADVIIAPALMCMLFGLFLNISLAELRGGFANLKFTGVSLAINFIWTPVLGWLLGGLFLADFPALRIGFIMLLVTPCTDWYLVFTGLAKGNIALSASILPVNLIVQVALLPIYLFLFSGLTGQLETEPLVKSILLVLALPFGLAQCVRKFMNAAGAPRQLLFRIFGGGQFWFLCAAIVAMFASQSACLSGNLGIFFTLGAPVALFFILNFMLGRLVSGVLKFSFQDSVSLNLTTLARNSPISLAIAVTAFPHQPLIALALVIGPLIELPFLGLISQLLLWIGSKQAHPGERTC